MVASCLSLSSSRLLIKRASSSFLSSFSTTTTCNNNRIKCAISGLTASRLANRHHPFSTTPSVCNNNNNNNGIIDSNNVVSSPHAPIPDTYKSVALHDFVSADWLSERLRNKTAMLDGNTQECRTFGDYHADKLSISYSLQTGFGIAPDSIVAVFTSNHVDFVPIACAVGMCGAKMTPLNPLYTPREVAVILQQSRSEVIICHADTTLAVTLEAVKECPTVQHIIVIPSVEKDTASPEGTVSLTDLKQQHPSSGGATAVIEDPVTHPFLVPYSSGTTGVPKGVCLSHSNMVANLLQINMVEGPVFPPDHKLISPLPFFHIFGLIVSCFYCAWQGQTMVAMSGRFDLEQYCQLVQKHQPQRTHLVPPILLGLVKSPFIEQYNMTSLQYIMSGAAPLSAELEKDIETRLCPVKQSWGMSELSPVGTMNTDHGRRSGSVGQLVSSTFGKIVDAESLVALPPNTPGELWIKGPQVMMGYLDAPEKTAETMCPQSEWLRTGDIAHYDEDGYIYVTDRLKELIKVRGYPVAPAELEALLLTHDKIQDAAVISTPHETSGEVPRAYVVLQESSEDEEKAVDEIYQWVKERVAPYKRLDGGIVLTDVIPKSGSGKILRRLLKDQEKAH